MDTTSLASLAQIYIGYFGRAPEPEGLAYWADALEGGRSLSAIAEDFATQAETRALYPQLIKDPPEDLHGFLSTVFQHLFGRAADDEGRAFWVSLLEAGSPIGAVILGIIEGATGRDVQALQNRVDLALQWHDFAATEDGFAFSSASSANSFDALSLVDADAVSIAEGSEARLKIVDFFNDVPSISLLPIQSSFASDVFTSSRLAVAEVLIQDDDLGTNVVTLVGADAGLFEIAGNIVFLKAGVSLANWVGSGPDVSVVAMDDRLGRGLESTKELRLTVTPPVAPAAPPVPVTQAPEVSLTNVGVEVAENEGTPTQITIADFAIRDVALGTNTLPFTGVAKQICIVGNDTVSAGGSKDSVSGGQMPDTSSFLDLAANATLIDFVSSESDQLDFSALDLATFTVTHAALSAERPGVRDAGIKLDSDTSIVLIGFNKNDLSSADFIFV